MYRFTSPENQKLFWVPYNENTKNLFYDQRAVISAPRDEPVCWSISKVEDMNVKGIIRLTWKQDRFNSHTDLIEYDEDGNYVCAWCDYFRDGVPISDEEHTNIPTTSTHSVITYSGIKPEIKVNGSFKKFTVTFYDDEDNTQEALFQTGTWEFKDDDLDVSDLFEIEDSVMDPSLKENQIKIRFIGDDEWIDKNIEVWYISDSGIKSHVTVNIVGL